MAESVDKEKPKVKFSDVLGSLLNRQGAVKSGAEVVDRFHKGAELNDRSLPMISIINNPRGVLGLQVNAEHCKDIGFKRCARLRELIVDYQLRDSVGNKDNRQMTIDALNRQMAQEFEIKKHSKGDTVLAMCVLAASKYWRE